MTDPNLTHLVLVLDRSSSMGDDGKDVETETGVRALLKGPIWKTSSVPVTKNGA